MPRIIVDSKTRVSPKMTAGRGHLKEDKTKIEWIAVAAPDKIKVGTELVGTKKQGTANVYYAKIPPSRG